MNARTKDLLEIVAGWNKPVADKLEEEFKQLDHSTYYANRQQQHDRQNLTEIIGKARGYLADNPTVADDLLNRALKYLGADKKP